MIEPIDLRTLAGKLPIAEQHDDRCKRSLYKAVPQAWRAAGYWRNAHLLRVPPQWSTVARTTTPSGRVVSTIRTTRKLGRRYSTAIIPTKQERTMGASTTPLYAQTFDDRAEALTYHDELVAGERLGAARATNGGPLPGLEGCCERCGRPCGEDGQVLAGLLRCKRCQEPAR